jgi:DNA-binding NarL/FixJ family response regulator
VRILFTSPELSLILLAFSNSFDTGAPMLKAPGVEHPVRPKTSEVGHAVRVVVADASCLKCQLMVTALQSRCQRIVVVGAAVDSMGIRKVLRENRADIAVIGSDLKDGPIVSFEVVREVRASYSAMGVIMTLDSAAATMVVEAFRAGAYGVLSRDDSFEELCKSIHAVYAGQVWANSKQLHVVIEALGKCTPPAYTTGVRGARLLTQREEAVVGLVAQGLTNRDIAQQLILSEHTVRNYLFRIFNKLGTSNRLELALYSIHRDEGSRLEA